MSALREQNTGHRPDSARSDWQAHLLGAALVTGAGLGWLLLAGPMPVVRGTTPLDTDVPLSYMIVAFPFLGILLAGVADRFRSPGGRRQGLVLLVQTGLVCLLSALRLKYRLPISGHLLLLAFFLLYGVGSARSALRLGELLAGGVVFLALLAVKLAAWNDWLTPAVGIGLAVLIWLAGKLYERRTGVISMGYK